MTDTGQAPLGVGMIGASWGAFAHIPAIAASPEFRLAAIATSRMESARAAAERLGVGSAFDNPDDLARHPDVDVVAVCVRVPEHRRLVEAALAAGKHVYCEWPLARDTAEAELLAGAARKAGVVHAVGLQARVAPQVLQMKAMIEGGEIGSIISAALAISGTWGSTIAPTNAYLQTVESGGNYFTIAGGHALDAFCDVTGGFTRLAAQATTRVREVALEGGGTVTRNSPDHFAVAGTLAGGAFGTFAVRGLPAGGTGLRFEVNGEKGGLVIEAKGVNPMMQMSHLVLSRVDGTGALTPIEPEAGCYWADRGLGDHAYGVGQTYARLAEAIRGGRPVPVDFNGAVANHRLLDAIARSAREGTAIDV